jgi:hypothetical protein
LVFVSGHPGHTSRLLTISEREFARDVALPRILQQLYRQEVALTAYSGRSRENARRAKEELFGVQNGRKALEGRLAGLLNPETDNILALRESNLLLGAAARPELRTADDAIKRIKDAQEIMAENERDFSIFEGGIAVNSELFGIARTLVRAAAERTKPNGERLEEYSEAHRESLELDLFSERPIYKDLEQLKLADSLTFLVGEYGISDAKILPFGLTSRESGYEQSPRERARDLVQGTQLSEVAFRRKLYDGGQAAIDASTDPMIQLARNLDGEARRLRKVMDTQDEIKHQAHAQIAAARFALEGASGYPDATFTLRLAFGAVKGVEENGEAIAPFTTIGGLFARAADQDYRPPFDLPASWLSAREKLNPATPLNFISTADIIGGNSGSPVVNRAGEFVGIIFDGNRASLALEYAYDDVQARAVSVDVRGILEALRVVYHADGLVKELESGWKPSATAARK